MKEGRKEGRKDGQADGTPGEAEDRASSSRASPSWEFMRALAPILGSRESRPEIALSTQGIPPARPNHAHNLCSLLHIRTLWYKLYHSPLKGSTPWEIVGTHFFLFSKLVYLFIFLINQSFRNRANFISPPPPLINDNIIKIDSNSNGCTDSASFAFLILTLNQSCLYSLQFVIRFGRENCHSVAISRDSCHEESANTRACISARSIYEQSGINHIQLCT